LYLGADFALFLRLISNSGDMGNCKGVTLVLLAVVTSLCAQDDSQAIIAAALRPSPIESNLRRLTDEIGGRVPGTPAMANAVA